MLDPRSSIVGLCTIAVWSCGFADVAYAQSAGHALGRSVVRDEAVYDEAALEKQWAKVQERYPLFARSHVELQEAVLSAASVYSRLASAAASGQAEEPIVIDTRGIERVLSNGALGMRLSTHRATVLSSAAYDLLHDYRYIACMQQALHDCMIMGDDGTPDLRKSCVKAKTDACAPEPEEERRLIVVPAECIRYRWFALAPE